MKKSCNGGVLRRSVHLPPCEISELENCLQKVAAVFKAGRFQRTSVKFCPLRRELWQCLASLARRFSSIFSIVVCFRERA